MAKKPTPDEMFYDHLTLGLIKALVNIPRVHNVNCDKREPCEKVHVANWEQRQSVYLPEDMKKFYQSTDGFLLQWMYQYAPSDLRKVGFIHVPQLQQITVLRESVELNMFTNPGGSSFLNLRSLDQSSHCTLTALSSTNSTISKDIWGHPTPHITAKSKVFEINNINSIAKVCMVYESSSSNNPKFYLLELDTLKWIFLSDTFSEYFRMAISHLGLPYWELCFSNIALPSWAEQLFLLIAPHLLENKDPRLQRHVNPSPEHPYNIIDASIFVRKPKHATKANAPK